MNSTKRSTELPKHEPIVDLPLRIGMKDGSNAHLVFDAKEVAMGTFYGIKPGMSVAQAEACPLTAEQFKKLQWMVKAVNALPATREAFESILLTVPGRRVTKIATEALKELKE